MSVASRLNHGSSVPSAPGAISLCVTSPSVKLWKRTERQVKSNKREVWGVHRVLRSTQSLSWNCRSSATARVLGGVLGVNICLFRSPKSEQNSTYPTNRPWKHPPGHGSPLWNTLQRAAEGLPDPSRVSANVRGKLKSLYFELKFNL